MAPRSPISPSSAALRAQRLSVIAEDGTVLPPIPPRSTSRRPSDGSSLNLPIQTPTQSHYSSASIQTSNRPQSRRWTDKPPHHSADASPPGYEHWDDSAPRSKRAIFLEKVRGNRQIARRGGWKRLVIGLAILIAVIIALGVGLGVGLRQRNANNSSNADNNGNNTQVFPAGQFAIPVYSALVDTSCTAIASTWLCYPYNTYSASNPGLSLAQYNWIITNSAQQPQSYNISTSQNPFADIFTNIPLTLTNAGTADEHYAFTLTLQKVVVPRTSLAASGATTSCFYNNTIFHGELYTRKPSMNISSSALSMSSSITQQQQNSITPADQNNWQHWPYAVNITQSIAGGTGVPDCYALNSDGSIGASISTGLTPQDPRRSCVCGYRNFGL